MITGTQNKCEEKTQKTKKTQTSVKEVLDL